ncbi:MAG TPA: YafY family protein [Dehalococcoidia bacterium]|nr:YafY family protein [Dehalococcoidia bacterium]
MDRRLLILMRLREEQAVRASDLAEECECSVRTVYRDIDALCQAGVPIAAMPGEGYRLVSGYHLPPIAFAAEEAVQILLGLDLALRLGTMAQRDATKSAAAKVEAVLTPDTRQEVARLRERIRASPHVAGDLSPFLPVLQEAVVTDRVVHIQYHSYAQDERTERDVEAYYLVFYSGDWHLVGYCRLREDVRDFRASRIDHAELRPEKFERPPKIDDGYYHEHDEHDVRVWIAEGAARWAREEPAFGFEGEEPAEGGVIFHFRVYDLGRLMPWILSRGASARVLSPPDLVLRLRAEAQALAERYPEG